MTRDQKLAKARELRAAGWTAPQIGHELEVPDSTIRNWTNGGECVDCGAPIDGSRAKKAVRCIPCAGVATGAARKVWTRDAVLGAIRRWASEHGAPPAMPDWRPSQAERINDSHRADEYRAGGWPEVVTVIREFGSWNAAITAAGFEPRPAHCPPQAQRSPTSRPIREAA